MSLLQFELGKFQKCRSKGGQSRMSASKRIEIFQRPVPSPQSKIESRQIPLRKRTPRLGRISCPAIEFSARRLSFGAIKFVQFCKNARQIDIGRPMFDKIFQRVIAVLRRFQLEMCVSKRE